MSTNNKTMADVQPGGRVRLGGQAERARFEAWCASQRFPLGTSRMPTDSNEYRSLKTREAWRVWQAALAAQPSPAGQGDALQLANEWRHVFSGDGHDMAGANKNTMRRFIKAIEYLAARQPVGEQ